MLRSPCPSNVRFSHFHTCITPHIAVSADRPQQFVELNRLGLLAPNTWHQYNDQVTQFKQFSANKRDDQVKSLLFVRHAQGIHNQAEEQFGTHHWETHESYKEDYLDADLTPLGRQQAEALRKSVDIALLNGLKVDCIVVSPLSRAIETTLTGFRSLIGKVPIVCIETCRETIGRHTCDKRRSRSELQAKFPDVNFAFLQGDTDELFDSKHRESSEIVHRAASFLDFIFNALPYESIVIGCHWGIARACGQVLQRQVQPNNGAQSHTDVHDSKEETSEEIIQDLIGGEYHPGYDMRNTEMLPVVAVRTQIKTSK